VTVDAREIEDRIVDFFHRNLRELEADKGHALAPGVRETALQQVKLYYRRLQDIADRVTDTEVKLSLPGLRTEGGRPFTIEGVVDIVREEGRTVLYDIKTHDAQEVRANLPEYEKQLNVYAHIWQGLRGEGLDETAVICTRYPADVDRALRSDGEGDLERALAAWEPLIPLPLEPAHVEDIIREFGETVDQIESHRFDPPHLDTLRLTLPGMTARFAVAVCRNCDARFSCGSYRQYAVTSSGGGDSGFRQYLEDLGDDLEQEEFRAAALEAAPAMSDDLS
jgi:hypothetical protein